jgi:hypothetical protein
MISPFVLLYLGALISHNHIALMVVAVLGIWNLWTTFLNGWWPHIGMVFWFWLADYLAASGNEGAQHTYALVTVWAFYLYFGAKIATMVWYRYRRPTLT